MNATMTSSSPTSWSLTHRPAFLWCSSKNSSQGFSQQKNASNNWLQSLPTRYRLVDSGAGSQQVSTRYSFSQPVTGPATSLTVQCFTQTGYRVFLPSPFNSVAPGAGRQDTSTRNCFNRPVTESTDRMSTIQPSLYRLFHSSRLQSLPT